MNSEIKERIKQLCERAAVEEDPKKVFAMICEMNELLDQLRPNEPVKSVPEPPERKVS